MCMDPRVAIYIFPTRAAPESPAVAGQVQGPVASPVGSDLMLPPAIRGGPSTQPGKDKRVSNRKGPLRKAGFRLRPPVRESNRWFHRILGIPTFCPRGGLAENPPSFQGRLAEPAASDRPIPSAGPRRRMGTALGGAYLVKRWALC